MGRSVVIAGIGKACNGIPAWRPGMEVWGINDCYQHCKEIKRFYKIYNIHKAFPECIQNGRFKDWERNYNASKALVITAKDLGLRKQRILDITKLITENPDYVFCSSISYAIFEAVNAGYDEIRLYRVSLNAGEYATQGRGIIENIKWAQRKGVAVYWPWYKEVNARYTHVDDNTDTMYGEGINWADIRGVQTHYGETAEPGFKVEIPKVVTKQPNTVAELKAAIKAKGGKLPHNAKKQELIKVLEALDV